jgi:endonuclease-8
LPEGDTIFRAARTLHHALVGQQVDRFESVYPALTRVDTDRPLHGRTIESVSARGKHLLMAFSGDLTLHTHMRMHGSWHIYRVGERWRAPARDMRIIVGTTRFVAVGFNIPVAEFLTGEQLARHVRIQALGPDLADPAFDKDEVLRRMSAHAAAPIHEVLLDQRVIAGIGNVLKSEVLFVAGVNPFAATGSLDEAVTSKLLSVSLRLMAMNVNPSPAAGPSFGRRTTGSLDPRNRLFVYGRGGKPCRRCGTRIESTKTGLDARLTYWCPHCQPAMRAVPTAPESQDTGIG